MTILLNILITYTLKDYFYKEMNEEEKNFYKE